MCPECGPRMHVKPPPPSPPLPSPPPPPPPPLCAGCVPCVWSLLEDTAVHPFVDASAVGIKGASPLPEELDEPSCAARCESEQRCVAYTFKFGDDAHKCWLMSTWSRATSVAGFASGFCSRGARGTCCLDGTQECGACARGVAPTSFCHFAPWACDACSERRRQANSRSEPLLYCAADALPPPPPPPPPRSRSPAQAESPTACSGAHGAH